MWCPTCPSVRRLSASIVTGSPAHVSALSGRSIDRHPAGSPQPPPGGAGVLAAGPVAFRPPAFASWASCPAEGLRPSLRSAYPSPDGTGPRRGFHVPRMQDATGVGAPSTPRPAVFTRPASQFRSPLAASTSGQALPPGCSSRRSGLCVTRRHRGFTCVRPSGLPLARLLPGRNGGPWASPSSFAPPAGRTRRAHVEVGTDLEH